jgi:hypothetical protein
MSSYYRVLVYQEFVMNYPRGLLVVVLISFLVFGGSWLEVRFLEARPPATTDSDKKLELLEKQVDALTSDNMRLVEAVKSIQEALKKERQDQKALDKELKDNFLKAQQSTTDVNNTQIKNIKDLETTQTKRIDGLDRKFDKLTGDLKAGVDANYNKLNAYSSIKLTQENILQADVKKYGLVINGPLRVGKDAGDYFVNAGCRTILAGLDGNGIDGKHWIFIGDRTTKEDGGKALGAIGFSLSKKQVYIENGWTLQVSDKLKVNDLEVTGAKKFCIDHPLEPLSKMLSHAAIEGPEAAVYYRGVGLLADGRSVIRLPKYFEALTRKEERTVQLTPIHVEGGEPPCSLSASMIENGQFEVKAIRNLHATQRFFWEVKAVRADIDPLRVEEVRPHLPR